MEGSEGKHGIRRLRSPDGGRRYDRDGLMKRPRLEEATKDRSRRDRKPEGDEWSDGRLKRPRLEEATKDSNRHPDSTEDDDWKRERKRTRRHERGWEQEKEGKGQQEKSEQKGQQEKSEQEGKSEQEKSERKSEQEGKSEQEKSERKGEQEKRERKSRWDIVGTVVPHPSSGAQVSYPTYKNTPTQYLLLQNMFDTSAEKDEEFYKRIEDDVHTRCARKGSVLHGIHVDRRAGCLCLMCDSILSAGTARDLFDGKPYDGRMISCTFLEKERYSKRFGR